MPNENAMRPSESDIPGGWPRRPHNALCIGPYSLDTRSSLVDSMQVHSWELQPAAHGGHKGSRAAEAEDVHALLHSVREDQDPELGLGNPTLLTAVPPPAGSRPGGPEFRRSNSSRSTASRMSSRSPPRGR